MHVDLVSLVISEVLDTRPRLLIGPPNVNIPHSMAVQWWVACVYIQVRFAHCCQHTSEGVNVVQLPNV